MNIFHDESKILDVRIHASCLLGPPILLKQLITLILARCALVMLGSIIVMPEHRCLPGDLFKDVALPPITPSTWRSPLVVGRSVFTLTNRPQFCFLQLLLSCLAPGRRSADSRRF